MTIRYTFYKRLCRCKISIRWQVIPNRSSSAEKVAIRSHGMKFMQWFNLVVVTSKLSELPITCNVIPTICISYDTVS